MLRVPDLTTSLIQIGGEGRKEGECDAGGWSVRNSSDRRGIRRDGGGMKMGGK